MNLLLQSSVVNLRSRYFVLLPRSIRLVGRRRLHIRVG